MRFKSSLIGNDKPVVGLDRDGVINDNTVQYYTFKPEQFKPIPGSLEGIALIRKKGYKIVIISNQGGISKKLYSENDVNNVHNYMLQLLGEKGCPSIDGIFYSTSSNKNDYYAKPNVGMFKRAEEEIAGLQFAKGWYVGDSLNDLKASIKMNSRPVLVRTGHGIDTEQELNKHTYKKIKQQTIVYNNLYEFALSL